MKPKSKQTKTSRNKTKKVVGAGIAKNNNNAKKDMVKAVTKLAEDKIPFDIIQLPRRPKKMPLNILQPIRNSLIQIEHLDDNSDNYLNELQKAKDTAFKEINMLFDFAFDQLKEPDLTASIPKIEYDEVPNDVIRIPKNLKPCANIKAMAGSYVFTQYDINKAILWGEKGDKLFKTKQVYEKLQNSYTDHDLAKLFKHLRESFIKEVKKLEESKTVVKPKRLTEPLPMDKLIEMFKEEELTTFHERSVYKYIQICAQEHRENKHKKCTQYVHQYKQTEKITNITNIHLSQRRKLYSF